MPPGGAANSWSTRKARDVTTTSPSRLQAPDPPRPDIRSVLGLGVDLQAVARPQGVAALLSLEGDAPLHAVQDLVVGMGMPAVRVTRTISPLPWHEAPGPEPLPDRLLVWGVARE